MPRTKAPKTPETDVIFRKYKDGDIIALFPASPGTNDPESCECYQHVGQHSHADAHGVIAFTRPAKRVDYEALQRELEGRGYVLRVVKKLTPRHLEARRAAKTSR